MKEIKVYGEKMFYYELHSHTNAASLCSIVEPEAFIQFYIDMGFSGMVITDHFYHGNTSVNRRLPWDMFIDEYCEGYYRAKREGDKHGFTVLFGFEQKFTDGNDEYIVLGISPEWLKGHPEIRDMDRISFFDTIHKANGFVIQAHPFRERYYISDIRLSMDYVDAVEVYNQGGNLGAFKSVYKEFEKKGLLKYSDEYARNEFKLDAILPWDFIEYPRNKDFLIKEYKRLLSIE